MNRTLRHHPFGDPGQATVELAVTLPVLVLLLLALLQVVIVARDHLAVWHAARVGVRAAAVSAAPVPDGTAAAMGATTLQDPEVTVEVDQVWVSVVVRHTTRTNVPLIGRLLSDVTVEARAAMVREPP